MNYKQFISSVSAFAIAATTFAAMAVTASATEYTDLTPTDGTSSGVTHKGGGVYTTNSTGYAGIVADLSTLTDIDQATSITVSFRTTVPTTSATSLVTLMYGVGDKTERGLNLAGSFTSHSYVKDGLVSYFGAESSTKYYINGNTTKNYAANVAGNTVDARIVLNRETGAYTTTLKCGAATINETGTVAVGTNITVIEAFTAGTQGADITLSNIKVSYTVPDAPAPESYSFDLDEAETVTGIDGSAVVVKNTVTGISSIDKITVVAEGRTKEFTEFDAPVIDGDTLIGIVVKGVSSVTSITIN